MSLVTSKLSHDVYYKSHDVQCGSHDIQYESHVRCPIWIAWCPIIIGYHTVLCTIWKYIENTYWTRFSIQYGRVQYLSILYVTLYKISNKNCHLTFSGLFLFTSRRQKINELLPLHNVQYENMTNRDVQYGKNTASGCKVRENNVRSHVLNECFWLD